jgi:hypothetical protein
MLRQSGSSGRKGSTECKVYEIDNRQEGLTKVITEVSVLEWIHGITHISGINKSGLLLQRHSQQKILNQVISGKSVIDFTKRKTGREEGRRI